MKWIVRLARTGVALLALWGGGFLWFVTNIPLASTSPAQPVAGIVVLTGGHNRVQIAVDLLQQGHGKRLFITGVNENISDDHLARVLGLEQKTVGTRSVDLFDCCIDTDRQALDTVGNAREIGKWAAARQINEVLVVTTAYHMPRALAEIERFAPNLAVLSYQVYPDYIKLERWWAYSRTARVLANEFNKYLFSLIRLRLLGSVGE